MLGICAVILSLLGFVAFFNLTLRRKIEDCFFYAISTVVFILYISGLSGHLEKGANLLCTIGIASLAYHALAKRPNLSLLGIGWIAIFSVPYIAFIFAISKNYVFTGWDEFSFWGSSIKLIYEEGGIYKESTPLNAFKNYPPAQQLWQYYIVEFLGWSEKTVLAAHTIFVMSCVQFSITKLSFKNRLASFSLFVGATASLYYFNYDFSHIYVDQLLAAYFACSLLLAIKAKDRIDFILLGLTLVCLVMIKQTGLIFALFCLFVVLINLIFRSVKKDIGIFDFLLVATGCMFAILASYKSWSLYVKSINFPSNISIPAFKSFFYKPLNDKVFATLGEFSKRAFDSIFLNSHNWFIKLSMSNFMLSLLAVSVAASFAAKDEQRKNLLTVNISMFFFGIAYLVFLIFCYIAFFTNYESIRLASFERYASTFFFAWVLVTLAIISLALGRFGKVIGTIASIFIAGIIVASAPKQYFADLSSITPSSRYINQVNDVSDAVNIIKKHISPQERAHIIDQDTNGYSAAAFNYLMLPNKPFSWCWSLGEKYRSSDVWTCKKTLFDVLKGDSYLYIKNADEQFWADNKQFFTDIHKVDGRGVYKINWSNDGKLTISPI